MLVTGFPLIVDRMTTAPVGLPTYPVIVIDDPLSVYWNFPDVAALACPRMQHRATTARAARFPRKTANEVRALMVRNCFAYGELAGIPEDGTAVIGAVMVARLHRHCIGRTRFSARMELLAGRPTSWREYKFCGGRRIRLGRFVLLDRFIPSSP